MIDVEVETLETADHVARRGAELVVSTAQKAIAARGRFHLALSGGSTPWRMVTALAATEMPWGETSVYQVDERVAPDGDVARNLTHLQAALAGTSATVVPMDVTAADLGKAASRYAATLPGSLDLVHLGLGSDGHTASLVPGDPVLDVTDRDVAVTEMYKGHRRLTLTYRTLGRARCALWLVTGVDKREAVELLLARSSSIPAGRVETAAQLVLLDREAAGEGRSS